MVPVLSISTEVPGPKERPLELEFSVPSDSTPTRPAFENVIFPKDERLAPSSVRLAASTENPIVAFAPFVWTNDCPPKNSLDSSAMFTLPVCGVGGTYSGSLSAYHSS